MINRRSVLLGSSLLSFVFVPKIVGAQNSPINPTYARKIIFSKKPLDSRSVDPAALTTEFTSRDNIYGIAYFDRPIKELLAVDPNLYVFGNGRDPITGNIQDVLADGDSFRSLFKRDPSWMDATLIYLDISPMITDRRIFPLFAAYTETTIARLCNLLPSSKYKLSLAMSVKSYMQPNSNELVEHSSGPLNITLSKSDYTYHEKQSKTFAFRYFGN
ncbi:hypothetical protein [Gloeobacter kilaueensis]|uniref:Uncharacterized protein n=1 Tax=Gloeobacter kilaueensis (strain ATCC BAA-2537 / CCAP 1431/1 / ULC 316 / JS1) TaxID=1183438 RepID=U5QIW6_GLOK1|nr:hypothetical protein [Gloeobacter kilaueensis]AGY58917.1 hypothetical protein GKIL_2671 [Gloeobacter kilaueensis JS1]